MTPASPEPTELQNRLRQQLILAQVRIMELEDAREMLAPRLLELERLLQSAQQLADEKLEEAKHLGEVTAATQAHAAAVQQQLDAALIQFREQSAQLARTLENAAECEAESMTLRGQLEAERARTSALAGELARLQATRSWRWTAWLRRLGSSDA
ncbi:MAG: hypothetical protein C0518_00450 [Opitutus sp.]|nr:hypothetical protein [Opitutus sp.]